MDLRRSAWIGTVLWACSAGAPETPDPASDAGTWSVDADLDPAVGRDAGGTAWPDAGGAPTPEPADPWSWGPAYGARVHPNGDLEVRVLAPRATRIELALFRRALHEPDRLRIAMRRDGDVHHLRISKAQLVSAELTEPYLYGLRAFGPNWPFEDSWAPGSGRGFRSDVDGDGNRMNPNKVLLDPYALEVSHDPSNLEHQDQSVFDTGPEHRNRDSGPFAPKGVAFRMTPPPPVGPSRPFKDEIIYEVHLKGLTGSDPSVPEAERGTYAGAARRARYLRELGVTAIEFLPLHETPNDQNELSAEAQGDNYWGYYSLSFFAPDRRYAADRGFGGPTRELQQLVTAFHAEGLKVYVDVVYNHAAEGGAARDRSKLLSWRGLDNAAYYELGNDPASYIDNNGVGPNLNFTSELTQTMVLSSLRYWHQVLGVDGFRFDLATVLGNRCARGCFEYERDGYLRRIAQEVPARPAEGGAGVDLIAEPWALGFGTYQVGNFPAGWAEWNDQFRETIRRDLNRLGVEAVRPRELMLRLSGSPDIYEGGGRPPAASVNFVVAHDGSTLHDLFSYASRNNGQAWPCGPSDGGAGDERQWDHHGDPALQRRGARTALALELLAAGVPMILGGDEMLRTQLGNNNAYNLDSSCSWFDWSRLEAQAAFYHFSRELFAFRNRHPALRPERFWRWSDADGDGRNQVIWTQEDGQRADDGYLDNPNNHLLGFLLDGDELGDDPAIYVVYNGWSGGLNVRLPAPPEGTRWHLVADTGVEAEAYGNFHPPADLKPFEQDQQWVEGRALVIWVAR